MQTYEILVRERSVLPNSADMTLVRTSIGIDQVHVLFDNSEWLDFPISITFGNGDTIITQSLTVSALANIDGWVAEGTYTIPWEVTQDLGAIRVTLQGTDSSGNHIITAYGAPLTVEECGDTASGTVPQPAPSQSEWEQAYADAQVAINSLQSKLDECDAAIEQMESWTMPTATTSTLGAVKPDGETVTVDADGTIHSTGGYELPTAASNVLGGVQVGDTLQINEFGTLNVSNDISDAIEASEVIADAFDITGDVGSETATIKPTALPVADTSTAGAVIPDGTSVTVDADGTVHANATVPTASASTLGGIKVGSGLAIDVNGVLSVDIPDGDSTSY